MNKEYISLAHGNGGRLMNELIHQIIAPAFNMTSEQASKDAVALHCDGTIMVTTDGYTVDPLFFPGGDIGKLAVCGTLNDLLVSGAIPQYLTVNFFIEEGFAIRDLKIIVQSMGQTATANEVSIIAGDTKVLPKGLVSGIQIATTGFGRVSNSALSMNKIQTGDKIYVTGPVGDHGAAVMLAREEYGLKGNIKSDCQSVKSIAELLMQQKTIKFMRDPTRGGLATVCHEISQATGLGVHLVQNTIPIREGVVSVCELLGFDPLYLACEGRIVFVTSPEIDMTFLADGIAQVGIISDESQQVIMKTSLGGSKIIPELENESLPRIC